MPKMSRWSQLTQNQEMCRQVQNYYQGAFPVELRYFLCQWIEEKPWHLLDPDNPSHESVAAELLKEMLEQLQLKHQSMVGDDFLIKRMRLEQIHREFQNLYQNNAMGFLRVMKECMQKELEMLQAVQTNETEITAPTQMDETKGQLETTDQQITAQLQEFNIKVQKTERKYEELQQKQESLIIQNQEYLNLKNQIQQLHTQMEALKMGPSPEKFAPQLQEWQNEERTLLSSKTQMETQLSERYRCILALRIELAKLFKQTVEELQVVQKSILDEELIGWKRRQQLAGNGNPLEPCQLEMLQHWCENLAKVIWTIKQQIKNVRLLQEQLPSNLPPNVQDHLPGLYDVITDMLKSLITRAFIVEQQPPQVLKKESRFSATVCLLVGRELNVQMNPPVVQASIISEQQARNLLQGNMNAKIQNTGDILNNSGTMGIESGRSGRRRPHSSDRLSVQFRNMQLKNFTRSDKKSSEAVTEEKFCILFQSAGFKVGDDIYKVWTLSLPVVVTVHCNQECNALATVLWDNAFSEPGREYFVVPESVPWPELGEQLSVKFQQMTDRGLTSDNLDYLASKIFGPSQVGYAQHMVSWVQFNKDTLQGRNFTLWEWFFAALKLMKEHLKGPWKDGSIIGFISKQKVQECLNQKDNGTFLLRFSDSQCGGITIAWINDKQDTPGEREVLNLEPNCSRDFAMRGLGDRIKDLKILAWLYPDIPKDNAFAKYYTPPQDGGLSTTTRDGFKYVRSGLVLTVPSQPGGAMCDMTPGTPQSIPPTSPAVSSVQPNSPFPDPELVDFAGLGVTDLLAQDYNTIDMDAIDDSAFINSLE